jgi:hypothetical protein
MMEVIARYDTIKPTFLLDELLDIQAKYTSKPKKTNPLVT